MKVIFTKNFLKNLLILRSIKKDDIIALIRKYPDTTNLKEIDSLENAKIIKGYLLSKKVRILILFQNVKGKFVPVSIVKKETKRGENITKDNYIKLFGNDIDKSIIDFNLGNYEEIEI